MPAKPVEQEKVAHNGQGWKPHGRVVVIVRDADRLMVAPVTASPPIFKYRHLLNVFDQIVKII